MNLNHLLGLVSNITTKYAAKTHYTGENFNIFSILKLTGDEVRLHSRFIGELLNPSGAHGQGSKFLELFISEIKPSEDYTQQQINKAEVIVEESIGEISVDYEKGGRIDLVIKFPDTKRHIVIENKIWAADQFKQLWRYYSHYPDAHLLYLTPKKRYPSKDSLHKLTNDDLTFITYENHIRKWIEACLKESVNHPLIREVLNQYLNTIKIIVQQTNIHEMNNEIIDEIIASGNIESALVIGRLVEDLKLKIMDSFKGHLSEMAKVNGFELLIWDKDSQFGKKGTAFLFTKDNSYAIEFYFNIDFADLVFGIVEIKDDEWLINSFGKKYQSVDCFNNATWDQVYKVDAIILNDLFKITKDGFEEIEILKQKNIYG
jgi:hypothetical protein